MTQSSTSLLDLVRDISDLSVSLGEASQAVPGLRAAARGFCRVMSGTPGGQALQALNIGNICTPYWNEDGRTAPVQGDPPFEGGQCAGDTYQFTRRMFEGDTPLASPTGSTLQGPLSVGRRTNEFGGREVFVTGGGGQELFCGAVADGTRDVRCVIENIQNITNPADDCGDPPPVFTPGDGYNGEEFNEPQIVPGPDGNDYEVVVRDPTTGPGGNLEIPVEVDGLEFSFGGDSGGDFLPSTPDYNNPASEESPGPGGGGDGGDNPPDGIDSDMRVAAVTVTITTEPLNSSREVGGAENIFVEGISSDGGWFRWKVNNGFTEPQRLQSRSSHFIFSPGICSEADGFQVKFSQGYGGFATTFICTPEETM